MSEELKLSKVDLDQAKVLKQLDFPQDCGTESYVEVNYDGEIKIIEPFAAPSLELVKQWLRVAFDIHICPRVIIDNKDGKKKYLVSPWDIARFNGDTPYSILSHNDNDDNPFLFMDAQQKYDNALKIAISKVLEYIKGNRNDFKNRLSAYNKPKNEPKCNIEPLDNLLTELSIDYEIPYQVKEHVMDKIKDCLNDNI